MTRPAVRDEICRGRVFDAEIIELWSAQDLVDTPFLASDCRGFEAVWANSV